MEIEAGKEIPLEITPEEASRKMKDANVFLLDVRYAEEYEASRIPGFLLIPLPELQKRINELRPYKNMEILVVCHHGVRSLMAAKELRKSGFNAKSISGGISEWAAKIDKTMPQYRKWPVELLK